MLIKRDVTSGVHYCSLLDHGVLRHCGYDIHSGYFNCMRLLYVENELVKR